MCLCWVTRSVSPFISHRLLVLFPTQSQTTASSLLNNTQLLNHTHTSYSWAFGIAQQVFTRRHYACSFVKSESVIHVSVCEIWIWVHHKTTCVSSLSVNTPASLINITYYSLWSSVWYYIGFNNKHTNVWMASISFKLNSDTTQNTAILLSLCSGDAFTYCMQPGCDFWLKAHIKSSHLHRQSFVCPSLQL